MATQFVVRDILRQAWSLTPMLGISDTMNDDEMRKALGHLRLLIDERNGDGWFQYKRITVQFTLGSGIKQLSIGTDAANDVVTPNTPNSLYSARYSDDSGLTWHSIGIITDYMADNYSSFHDTDSLTIPTAVALYREDGDVSYLKFRNVSDKSYLIQIEYDYAIENVNQNTILSMPPVYQSYFVYTIAYYLSAEYKDPNQWLEQRSLECYKKITRKNRKMDVTWKDNGFSAVINSGFYGTKITDFNAMKTGPVK